VFSTRTLIPLLFVFSTFSAFSPPLFADAPKEAAKSDDVENCLSCHGDKDASFKLKSGEVVSIYVAKETFDKSVHGPLGSCTGCHAAQADVPHPDVTAKNKEELAATFREACKSCHFENYTKAIDSVHYKVLAKGGNNAPFCADCHGSHDIAKPNAPRTKVSATCGSCHAIVAGIYAKSVHGKALAAGNTDVPVCTDCHHAHDIADPRTTNWRLTTVALCGSCHSNKTMMAKYGLSTNVLKSYLSDFHGMSASLAKGQKNEPKAVTALCIDCHGTHDIVKVKDSGSQVLQANLQKTCSKCHTGSNANLPGAWLSHYEPSIKHAPLVWLVNVAYMIFIPFVIGGLVLQILLHLWRVMVNR
jgi:Cytochrome c3